MYKAIMSICALLMIISAKAQTGHFDVVGEIKNDTGVVRITDNFAYIELQRDPSKRYVANNINPLFKVEGTTVVFSGQIGKIPPNVRMMATPFKVTAIKLLEAPAPPKTQGTDFEWYKTIKNVKATIQILANGQTVVLVPLDNPNQRYISQQLPAEYKKEGLQVTFTGMEGKIPPNFRMMGTPLKLTKICVSQQQKKKYGLKKAKYTFK